MLDLVMIFEVCLPNEVSKSDRYLIFIHEVSKRPFRYLIFIHDISGCLSQLKRSAWGRCTASFKGLAAVTYSIVIEALLS